MKTVNLMAGNCLETLKNLEDNSIDSIVTDPPYGISFMGKKWDYDVPSVEIWKECFRVLKAGGHILAFAGTRTQHRMAINIEDAGFEIRDMLAWVYGSGFPKSLNISKAIDKNYNKNKDELIKFGEMIKEYRGYKKISQRELGKLIGVSRELINLYEIKGNNQQQFPTKELWLKIKNILEIPSNKDYIYEEIEREVIGIKTTKGEKGTAGGYKNGIASISGNDINITRNINITKPSTPEAIKWEGWGSALKPALEPITLARKPLDEKTIAANVLKHGTGGINIDGCRIERDEEDISGWSKTGGSARKSGSMSGSMKDTEPKKDNPDGRFPANFIHDGSDENLELLDKAARYFYCPKASKVDRNEGVDKNAHPTVKPTDLMRYLCRLITPVGGTVLDPFMGSGSTGKAAILEDFNFIGCEMDEDYIKIAQARIDFVNK